jgi:PAS domain S-box-containing protein
MDSDQPPASFEAARDFAPSEESRSAAYLELALAASEMGTWDWNAETDAVTMCARTRGFFELGPGQHRWSEMLQRIHPDDREAIAFRVMESVENRHDYVAEYRVLLGDGALRWLSARGRTLYSPDGKPLRMHGVVTDITARREHESELERLADATAEHAQDLQAVLDAAPVAIWIAHDSECRRITGNACAEREIMRVPHGSNVSFDAPPEEKKTPFTMWRDGRPVSARELPGQRAARAGETVKDEIFEMRFPDGRIVELLMNAAPLRDPQGRIRGAIATGADITALRRTESALRESEQRFRLMADASPVPIWVTDANGGVEFVNRAYGDYFGVNLSRDDPAEAWQRLVHPDDTATYVAEFMTAIAERRSFHTTVRVRRPDGELRWLASCASPRFAADGSIIGMVGSTPDITEIKQAGELLKSEASRLEALVEQRTARLQEALSEMEAFSYNISHDLRAPLRAMQSFSRFLLDECGPQISEQGRDYIARIIAASARMDRLIQDVLVYSRSARTELKLERVNLGRLMRTLFDAYPHLRERPADFEIAPDLPIVLGNDAALLQCFANVLGNAVKFIAPGVHPHVRVWAETGGGRTKIFIRDNGIGIPIDAQARIFEMFYRVNPTYDGTGIGLAVTRKSIERMGGQIGVESAPGRGSTFHFDLQLAP